MIFSVLAASSVASLVFFPQIFPSPKNLHLYDAREAVKNTFERLSHLSTSILPPIPATINLSFEKVRHFCEGAVKDEERDSYVKNAPAIAKTVEQICGYTTRPPGYIETRNAEYADEKDGLEKYDSIPADYYAKAIRRPFHGYWHRRRYSLVLHILEPHVKNPTLILDLGCDSGLFTGMLPGQPVGLDVSKHFVDFAHKSFGNRIPFLVGNAQELPFKDESFEAVTCLETLEHVPNPNATLREISRVLKKGGYATILVPNEANLLFHLIWWIWNKIGRGKVWRETHITDFTPALITEMMQKHLKIEDMQFCHFQMLIIVKGRKRRNIKPWIE